MNRLKKLRESKGMTQQELADMVGVTKGAVIHWEKYGFSSADKLQKLADCFNVSISYLLDYDTNNTFSELITKVNKWAISHGLDKGNPKIEWMKVTEEVGEIRDVFSKTSRFCRPRMVVKRCYRRFYRNASSFMLTAWLRRGRVPYNSLQRHQG